MSKPTSQHSASGNRPTQAPKPDILSWLRCHDWQQDFEASDLDRGAALVRQQQVHLLSVQGDHIRALCHSQTGQPYRQSIFLGKSGQRLHCACSCPVGMNCEHAAAVIAQVLDGAADRPLAAIESTTRPLNGAVSSAQTDAPSQPTPRLALGSHMYTHYDSRSGRMTSRAQHRAGLSFRYPEGVVHGRSLRASGAGKPQRQLAREQRLREQLQQLGFRSSLRQSQALPADSAEMFELDNNQSWLAFMQQQLPRLHRLGWEIDIKPGFHFDLSPVQGWYARLTEEADGFWFTLEIGITVDDQQVSLLPVLLEVLRQHPAGRSKRQGFQLSQNGQVHLSLTARRRRDGSPLQVMLPYDQLKPLLYLINDFTLIDPQLTEEAKTGTLRLALPDATRLHDLARLPLSWHGGERLRQFAERLRDFRNQQLTTPDTLQAQLRPYQREGLMWMQTLSELGVGGILGDDMGLGKTLQTLAHLLLEKQQGRLTGPVLVVMPTSLIFNWLDEAHRFAPSLKAAALHGPQRQQIFDSFAQYDLLLTSYSLLPRDIDLLKDKPLSVLVFDEAQNLKNPASKAALAARQLIARQRLCLTGTPLENHLGELWALFDLLMPGWLGDARQFAKSYRNPIEKQGNSRRLEQLKTRIRPFLLRRRKDKVAPELPAKNEFVNWVELTDAQRERYETLRRSMDQRVREAIDRQGLAKSRMLILDALLKLRLACCDLRLLRDDSGPIKGDPSGKLTLLMEMLDSLLAAGRRVLLFSQFTSMLALIEEALCQRGLCYVMLTGDTQDRRTPVRRFQNHEVPLFLISLKAGGTGLNLTSADTVIHYDPWWNPAVQSQATDRAYRIGQDKPVFVYQLIAQGTVEEHIYQLQKRKSQLASTILGNCAQGDWHFDEDDIDTLFAPLS